ncbi:ParB/RepB/Spo0J family partition protein [Zavarzinella formosa]|uniref:ParB/RepB/Spo0J family partition protein n=1 Tax=Zavarzinella formosa TaxID=360055 RepID=UPI0002DFCE63|nr:ParB/RepB/Spo0J family partition protein [Zavarzinella formosa]
MNSTSQTEDGLSLDDITIDTRLQFRTGRGPFGCDQETIERYAMEMKEGTDFPPILIVELSEQFEDHRPETLLLVGGFTRYCAAQAAGLKSLAARIRSGTWADAQKMAYSQNSDHGQPRKPNDLRRVIEAVRADNPGISIREIAKLVDCSKWMVHKIIGVANPKTAEPSGCPAPDTLTPPEENRTETEPENVEETADSAASSTADGKRKRANKEEEAGDPFAELRTDHGQFLDIAASLRALLKQVAGLKERESGAAVKYGVCEKHIEECRRHLLNFSPKYGLTDAARALLDGKDPSHGRGWLTAIEADRQPAEVINACSKF